MVKNAEEELEIRKNKQLIKEHPVLRPFPLVLAELGDKSQTTVDFLRTYDYSYTTLDDFLPGWQKLGLQMATELEEYLNKVGHLKEYYLFDVKEKWGMLRITEGGYSDDETQRIVEDYEIRSLLFCPYCGKPTKYITSGYILYLCDDCIKKPELGLTYRKLTPEDRPKIRTCNLETKEGTVEEPHKELFLKQWSN